MDSHFPGTPHTPLVAQPSTLSVLQGKRFVQQAKSSRNFLFFPLNTNSLYLESFPTRFGLL